MNFNNRTTVKVKKMVNGGYGLAGQENGKTALIRGVLPGETVSIVTIEARERFDYSSVVEIHEPHPGRVLPPCPYYGSCGGCDLQHADYRTQCSVKRDILLDLLERSSSAWVKDPTNLVEPLLPSPEEFGYRQRIRLQVGDACALGFHRFHSHEVVRIDRCLLAPERMNRCLQELRRIDTFTRLIEISEEVELQIDPSDDSFCLIFTLSRPPRPADRVNAEQLCAESAYLSRIYLQGRQFALEGPYTGGGSASSLLKMEISTSPPLSLFWEPTGFCQVNIEQNHNLVERVLQFCEPDSADRILDLFCGMGNFSLPLARRVSHVHGVESQGAAIRSARYNSEFNGLENTTFKKSAVDKACEELTAQQQRFDTIICDPPRQGMPGLASHLSALAGKRLVYVSCDPATLCRDLGDLCSAGFRVAALQPIDMFPQTHHIETVALLEKN